MLKSEDGGKTWAGKDTSNRPTNNDLENCDIAQDGDTLYIAHHDEATTIWEHIFYTSDHATTPDQWGTTDTVIVNNISASSGLGYVSMEVDPNGNRWCFFQRDIGALNNGIVYRNYTGTSWGNETTIENESGFDWFSVRTVMGAAGS